MHKTEITNLNKRHESQIEAKDQHIQTLEEKIVENKTKIKDLESKITEKANEFEYYIKEENFRKKEMEFKIKLENDKSKAIATTNREEAEHKVKIEKELERVKFSLKEKTDQCLKYEQNISALDKKIQKLSQKLIDLNLLREKDK